MKKNCIIRIRANMKTQDPEASPQIEGVGGSQVRNGVLDLVHLTIGLLVHGQFGV